MMRERLTKADYQQMFLTACRICDVPMPLVDYRKGIPGRKLEIDFAFVEERVGVELQGGIYAHMGHSTGTGIQRDYDKQNLAQLEGWILLQLSTNRLEDAPGPFMDLVKRALAQRQERT
jgi:very-short-patch-repair endonuclease